MAKLKKTTSLLAPCFYVLPLKILFWDSKGFIFFYFFLKGFKINFKIVEI